MCYRCLFLPVFYNFLFILRFNRTNNHCNIIALKKYRVDLKEFVDEYLTLSPIHEILVLIRLDEHGESKNREDEVYRFHKKSRYREVVIQQNISCCEIIYIRRGCEHFANSCSAIGTLVVIVIGYATVKSIRIGNISVILNGKVCNG